MATLIPNIDVKDIENPGERDVAKALVDQLAADVLVYHSIGWLQKQEHKNTGVEYLQPGEMDFVIVDPKKGLLVLEVKSSEIRYDSMAHKWKQKDRARGTWHSIDPFNQAEKNKYALLDRLKSHKEINDPLPFTVGHAVAFPDHRIQGKLPPNVDSSIILGPDSLRPGKMKASINRAFENWCRVRNPRPMSDHIRLAIQQGLNSDFKLIPVLWRTISQQEERIHRLTEQQAMILDVLQREDRVAIEGVAGSGKTLLAIAQAQRLAREGLKTLLLCYNDPLSSWINQNISDQFDENLTVCTFHKLCSAFCRKARIAFSPGRNNNDFWKYEAPELLEQACHSIAADQGYDAIVVDEGQDFEEVWWISLENIYRRNTDIKRLTVFYDPKQNLYVNAPQHPGDLNHAFPLTNNCRNTKKIAQFCGEILDFEVQTFEDAADGENPNEVRLETIGEVITHTRDVVQNWCLPERGNLKYSQVAILTPSKDHDGWPPRFGNVPLVRDFDDWYANKGILLTTSRRFKGLEADALVLAAIPEPGSKQFYTKADHYVASSRAKHMLEVIKLGR